MERTRRIEEAYLNGNETNITTCLPSKLVSNLLNDNLDCETNIIVINDKQVYYSHRLIKILISKICSSLMRENGDNCTSFKGEKGYVNLKYSENGTIYSFDISFSSTCHYQGSGMFDGNFIPDGNTIMNPKLTISTSDFIVML